MRYTGPKARLCRREGVNLFSSDKYAKALERNPNIPGMHGTKRQGKISDYGKQLREKQQAKRIYGLSENQFSKYIKKAIKSNHVTADAISMQIEMRADNVIYRAGFAMTRMQARQFISHGLFLLNGKKIDIPSIHLAIGDTLEIKPSKKDITIFKNIHEKLEGYHPPKWIKPDNKKMLVEILATTSREDLEQLFDPRLIVEFYSR